MEEVPKVIAQALKNVADARVDIFTRSETDQAYFFFDTLKQIRPPETRRLWRSFSDEKNK